MVEFENLGGEICAAFLNFRKKGERVDFLRPAASPSVFALNVLPRLVPLPAGLDLGRRELDGAGVQLARV